MITNEQMLEDRREEARDDDRHALRDDKRLQALKGVLTELDDLDVYLNSEDHAHDINIVDGGYQDECFQALGSSCDAARTHLNSEIEKEEAKFDVNGN